MLDDGRRMKFGSSVVPLGGNDPLPGRSDARLICSLAVQQLNYGLTEEAIAMMLAARHLWPEDPAIVTLLAQALLRAGRGEQASVFLREAKKYDRTGAMAPHLLLLCSIVQLHRKSIREARQLFEQFIAWRQRGGV